MTERLISQNSENANEDYDFGRREIVKGEGQGLVLEYCGEKGANQARHNDYRAK